MDFFLLVLVKMTLVLCENDRNQKWLQTNRKSVHKYVKQAFLNRIYALMCILFVYFTVNKPIWNETYADVLKRDLLMSYDKFARPTQHYNTTTVILDLRIKHVDFDETTSIFTVFAWFHMVTIFL